MENPRNLSSTDSIGFCLLPSELIHYILLNLAFPDLIRLKSLNKSISNLISDQLFIRDYNSRANSTSWLFLYKKRWHRDAVLHGFSDRSDRWFKFPIADLLNPVVPPGESVYFLASSGNIFLFSCNSLKEVIAVNLGDNAVKRIPPSPLGPRGTSSWRRSGMKLVSRRGNFRFLFTELVNSHPVVYVYRSETDTWESKVAQSDGGDATESDGCVFLNVVNGPHESVIVAVDVDSGGDPVVVRPRLSREGGEQLTVGFSWGNAIDRLHVYGDGHMLVIESNEAESGERVIVEVQLWGLGVKGRAWELKSRVPESVIEEIRKPYRVIMGCIEKREGVIRAALLSNYEGLWDVIWLAYEIGTYKWKWIQVPQGKMKGLNMAGVSLSSGLTL